MRNPLPSFSTAAAFQLLLRQLCLPCMLVLQAGCAQVRPEPTPHACLSPVANAHMQAILALAMVTLLACAASADTTADTNMRRPVALRRLLATALVDRSLCGPLTPASPGSTLGPGPCISQGRKLTCCGGGQCRIDTFLDAFTNPSGGATTRDTANCNAWACCRV